jgi:hypothetical protein
MTIARGASVWARAGWNAISAAERRMNKNPSRFIRNIINRKPDGVKPVGLS